MPGTETLLEQLSWIANEFAWFAVLWHCLLGGALVGLLTGAWHPRLPAASLLAAPLVTVSALAWSVGNPFNGLLFAALAVALVVIAARLPDDPVTRATPWAAILGAGAIAYAWVYPHFLDGPALAYVIASPMGLVPCPTLALVAGFGLLGSGFGSRAWTTVVGATAMFYGLVGVFLLGVWLDIGLLLVAAGLLATLRTAGFTAPAAT